MIIIQLIGGLGNQMFQYAMARRVALVNKAKLKLDVSGFETVKAATPRHYSLQDFNIIESFASPLEITQFRKSGIHRLIEKFKPYYKRSIVKEPYFHFDPKMLKLFNNVYLQGYWQSEKYFKDIEDVIHKEFTLKNQFSNEIKKLVQKMNEIDSVSIHIRRGDYVTDKKTGEVHGVYGLDYYHRAINQLLKSVSNPQFFVFSDDIRWAEKNLKLDYKTTFISGHYQLGDCQELILLSKCKHHIVANSSFSWWGAWLCNNKDKIIFAPQRWFGDKQHNTKDALPKEWIKI